MSSVKNIETNNLSHRLIFIRILLSYFRKKKDIHFAGRLKRMNYWEFWSAEFLCVNEKNALNNMRVASFILIIAIHQIVL